MLTTSWETDDRLIKPGKAEVRKSSGLPKRSAAATCKVAGMTRDEACDEPRPTEEGTAR